MPQRSRCAGAECLAFVVPQGRPRIGRAVEQACGGTCGDDFVAASHRRGCRAAERSPTAASSSPRRSPSTARWQTTSAWESSNLASWCGCCFAHSLCCMGEQCSVAYLAQLCCSCCAFHSSSLKHSCCWVSTGQRIKSSSCCSIGTGLRQVWRGNLMHTTTKSLSLHLPHRCGVQT